MKQSKFGPYVIDAGWFKCQWPNSGMSGKILASIAATSLLLSACGGGGGGGGGVGGGTGGAGPVGTAMTIAPMKGKFGAGCSVVVSNPAGSFTANGSTDATGQATVTIPSGATGPYVISVVGGGTCTYFNESTNTNVSYTTADSLHAVVPSASATGAPVAVTPLTEMEYTYLKQQAGGAITPAITDAQAVAAVPPVLVLAKSMGLLNATIDVQNMFALPPVIPAAGVTPAQLGQDGYSAMFGKVAAQQPSNPMAAVAAYALLAKAAALSAASSPAAPQALADAQTAIAAILPIAQAVSNMYGPASATGMAAPMSVTAATQAAAAAATSAAAAATGGAGYLSDLTAGGVHLFSPGYQYTIGAVTTTVAPVGKSMTATLSNATYSMVRTFKDLLNRIWTALVSTSSNTDYVLTAAGWSDDRTTSISAIANLDGTLTVNDGAYGRYGVRVAKIDISGMAIASAVAAVDANGLTTGAAVAPAGNFPAGSIEYDVTDFGLTSQDIHEVYAGSLGSYVHVLDATGIQLTALPAANAQFCVAGFRFIPTATAGKYDVYANPTLTCPALATGQLADGTVSFTPVQVNGQQLLAVTATTQVSTALPGIINGTFNSSFISIVNGKAYLGVTTPKGADTTVLFGTSKRYNRVAIDAQMNAANLPLL
ncbi:hypothetical protein FGKAn22_14080 [Ferrigenium kumadai]|uniref:Uncharacterized protein n=1 Tax=Ferrigenium kumadai TaxID=1682490 RepID=A0AAN1SZ23_9PROT|nr:hypothetical protein [Ferrigenium kumadai]BBI99715.1 hypothetical protein FGKAn22_14080 [Ferrigenium kumadai]